MTEICKQCGLPKELCVCETIAKEKQKIKVSEERKRFGKKMTIVEGIDNSQINCKTLSKKMKAKFACGGTYKNNRIELQGSHKNDIKEFLKKEGFPEDIIEIE